jgi:hypothetical protein
MSYLNQPPSTKKYSFAEINDAISQAEYALSLLSLDLLRPSWRRYFKLALSADDIVICSESARSSLIDYRKDSDALDDSPNFLSLDALEMKRHLSLLYGKLEDLLGTRMSTQVITWMDEFSRLSRQDSFGIAWSTI